MKRKLSGWSLSIAVRLFGCYVKLALYPLGKWSRLLLVKTPWNSNAWHFMAGPIHVHGYYLGWKLIELELDVSHDPFWGTAVRFPAGYRILLGRAA